MSAKTTLGRKVGSAARGPRALERLLIVAAVVAVLVSVGAWIAMNRPGAAAEAAGSGTADTASGGSSVESTVTDPGTDAATATDAVTGEPAADAAGSSTGQSAAGQSAAGQSAAGPSSAGQSSSGGSTGAGTGTGGGTGSTGTSGRSGTSTAPLSPTTNFLTALAASGLAPPIDDAQKLAMADDVCQELGYGSKYADVVRALTFAGATDAEATNFARLAITNLCSQYKIG
jgi:hypothetical protein